MNGLNEDKLKRIKLYWILGLLAGLAVIFGVGGFFILKSARKKQYTEYIQEAENYFQMKNYEQAIVSYRSAIEVDEKQYRPYEGLSQVYIVQGEYSQARLVLKDGMDITESKILEQIYIEIEGIPDGSPKDTLHADDQEEGNGDIWNDALIALVGGYSYQQYREEYGAGRIHVQNDGCVIDYEEMGARAYYSTHEGENVMNGATGTPFDGRVPSYLVFDDLTMIFYQCGDGMSREDVQAVIGEEPEVRADQKGGWLLAFQYLNCEFQIACDESGFINGPSAENKLIPLAKSIEGDMGAVTGSFIDAATGNPVEDVNVSFRSGSGAEDGDVVTSAVSDSSGEFEVSLPPDTYTMEFLKDGYITEYEEIAVLKGGKEDFGSKALSPNLGEGEWRIVLEWGDQPYDLDSHLVCGSYHVSFMNPMAGSKASLDVDDTDGQGPETITINEFDKDEHYEYYVHDYTNSNYPESNALGNSGATVKVYLPNGEIREFSVPGGGGNLWQVFTIDKGEIHEINSLNTGEV